VMDNPLTMTMVRVVVVVDDDDDIAKITMS